MTLSLMSFGTSGDSSVEEAPQFGFEVSPIGKPIIERQRRNSWIGTSTFEVTDSDDSSQYGYPQAVLPVRFPTDAESDELL